MSAAQVLNYRVCGIAEPENLPSRAARLRFPLRPKPFPHEFAPGYLIRAARANGYATPLSFWRTLSRCRNTPLAGLKHALNLCDAELAEIHGPFPAYTGIDYCGMWGLRTEDFNHHWLRWCPLCWAESLYLRVEWAIKLCCVCTRHQVVLAERCSHCGTKQKYQRIDLGHCGHCGASLVAISADIAPQPWTDLTQILMTSMYSGRQSGELEMTPPDWLRLIRYLGQISLDPAIRRPGQVLGVQEIEKAIALVDGAAQVLADWPQGMYGLLSRLRAMYPMSSHIGDAFGALYRVLYRKLSAPCFDFLRETFERYLHEHWFGLLGRRNRRLSGTTIGAHPRKSAQAIAIEAGAGRTMVCHLARQGLIEGLAVHHESGRTTWAIRKSEAKRVAEYVSDSITVVQASAMLGINRGRVRELIAAGLLNARIHREYGSASTWLLSRSSVESLAQLGGDLQELEAQLSATVICVRQVLKYWQLNKGELPALLRAMEEKCLHPLGRISGLAGIAGLTLSAEEVRRWLELHRSESQQWFSIDSAAKQLGVKQQVAYQLVKRGLLKASSVEFCDGRHRPVLVSRNSLARFRETHVALVEVARTHRTSPKRMLELLNARPVTGPRIDGGRQYFFRRDDVVAELQHLPMKHQGEPS